MFAKVDKQPLPPLADQNKMAQAHSEISLFLKYPGPPVALQRLQHSFLECVIEYKLGSINELQTIPPSQLRSAYQLKGTAALVDDELVIRFVPKNAGLHSVRIFGDTRELCRPVAFVVTQNNDVESTPYDQPVRATSSLFQSFRQRQPSHQNQLPQQSQPIYQPTMPSPPHQYSSPEQYSPPSLSQRDSMMSGPRDRDSFWQEFPTDPTRGPRDSFSPVSSPQHRMSKKMERQSFMSSTPLAGRPVSMGPEAEATYAGDLFTSKPDQNTFSALYVAKKNGQDVYGKRREFMAVDHTRAVTQDTFRMLEKDIDSVVTRGQKGKQRCAICNNKLKIMKMIELGEAGFCEGCFRRQYILRSAIDHFMVPSIQDCTVQVPVNKRATKFVSSRKTLANVNLRGLEPNEIRYAISEFRKFSPDDNGWINKAVLLPLIKACFSFNLSNPEIKSLLANEALRSMMTSFGLDERDEVHEIEFLALLAFLARERQRLKSPVDPNNKFTGADLQMAYAFKNHFDMQQPAPAPTVKAPPSAQPPAPVKPAYATPLPNQSARFRTSSAPPQDTSTVPLRNPNPLLQQQHELQKQQQFQQQQQLFQHHQQQRQSQMLQRESMYFPSQMGQATGNPLVPQRGSGLLSPTGQQMPPGFRSKPPSQYDMSELQQPQAQFPQMTPDNSMLYSQSAGQRQSEGGLLADLPEEDQDEVEIPTLPASKDPAGQTITKPLVNKRQANSKQMMEQLKLTGGVSDSWMLY